MNDVKAFVYNEIDFILDAHKFDVRFSYVTKEGLSFVREFVLRLLHISPLSPIQLATYFGFSKKEASEAIGDLLNNGDIQYSADGKIELTRQSLSYFTSLGSTPQVATLTKKSVYLIFELGGFNCLGTKQRKGEWDHAIKLDIGHEIIANSQVLASSSFKKQFSRILEKGYITGLNGQDGADRPRIYTIDSVKKINQEPLRLTAKFYLGGDGVPIELNDFENLDDSEPVHELIATSLSKLKIPSNLDEIYHAMDELNDSWTPKLFNESSIDVIALDIKRKLSMHEDVSVVPLLGQAYSQQNWELIHTDLIKILPTIKNSTNEKLDMLWIAPSDTFWEASDRFPVISGIFLDCVRTLKCQQFINTPVMYLPVSNESDTSWAKKISNIEGDIHGLLEGFLNGNVEIILVENKYVAVCYHYRSESFPVTLPFGFVSKNIAIIKSIQKVAFKYIEGMASQDNPNHIGILDKHKAYLKKKAAKTLIKS